MFEDQPTQTPVNNPLNPVMPAPGMVTPPPGDMTPLTPPPSLPPQPQIHTMPDKFQSSGGGRPKGSGGNRRLLIILGVVVVLAGLVIGGLYVFNQVLTKENTNNSNLANNTNTIDLNTNEAVTDTEVKSAVANLATVINTYRTENGDYPTTVVLDPLIPAAAKTILVKNGYAYQYCSSGTAKHYLVTATLGDGTTYYWQDDGTTGTGIAPACGVATNSNSNVNASNSNANTNTVTNANTNSNANANSNVNASNSNANTNTSTVTSPLPSSKDTDSDGLTDVEEALYETGVSNPDTDGDTFIDGKKVQADSTIIGELYLGYDPIKASGKLEASTIVKRVAGSANDYSIMVPSKWTTTNEASGGMLITPSGQTGEFFQVRVMDNTARLAPKQWYLQSNPSADITALPTLAVNGLEGIMSEDLSTAYLFSGAKVFSIQYSTGALTEVNYRTTFDMIIRNFKLVAAS